MSFFSCNALNAVPLNTIPLNAISPKCVSMNNQECRIRPEIINIKSNEPTFYPYSIKVNKYSGSCSNINDPYAKLCVPDVANNINVKVLNLMSITKKTRHIKWHETSKCKCRFDASVCNNKQHWHNDKYRCEYQDLIDKGMCDKGFIWNPSICECECEKLFDVGEYLNYRNCKFRKRLIDKLVEECIENIDGPLNNYRKICNSCTAYIVLLAILFIIHISISSVLFTFIGA